jgi:ABC-type transport system involved in multi-copper enzyme maturation permease subunit
VLVSEALLDGVRRRIVPVIAVLSVLSLFVIDSCTACGSGSFTVNGQTLDVPTVAGWSGLVIFVVLALWTMVLAGILASDHLVQTFSDGSAVLTLARPVGRDTFALARLAGALAIALAMGAVLLSATALLMHVRAGVPLGAAAWGSLACAAGALTVAALAMTVSLFLPQIATVLLVLAAVGLVAFANLLALFGAELGGVGGAIDRYGPPLCTAIAISLAPWVESAAGEGDAGELALRLAVWTGAAVGLLVLAFRRSEIGR